MPCYHPILGYRSRLINSSGKRSIVFNPNEGYADMPVTVPCGKCIGCRLERSRNWAIRCMHEASCHDENCFITLTFNSDNLDPAGSLRKEDFQKFMKRLRKHFAPQKIRYFHCGEYGDQLSRPHHHACLFGFDFHDKIFLTEKSGTVLYTSPTLEKLWPFGFSTIGSVTFESAAYVARYVMKKLSYPEADTPEADAARQLFVQHYEDKIPEYVTMSRRPGIGHDWFHKYKTDVYPSDEIIVRSQFKCKPPSYYDNLYDLTNAEEFAQIKRLRKKAAAENKDNSLARLQVKEKIKLSKTKQLRRKFENET